MKSPSRYILYTRVSTKDQDDNFSHDSQLAALQSHVLRRGGYVVETIRETQTGETFLGRQGMQRAIELLETDFADVLLCYDVSRYSRNVEHQQQIAKRIFGAGKSLEFATVDFQRDESGQLTPESDLMFGVSGSFAAYHRNKIRADSMRGRRQAALSGVQPSRSVSPLGYKVLTKADIHSERYPGMMAGQSVIIESQAQIIREIFARRIDGQSLVALAKWTNEELVKLGKVGTFTHSSIKNILKNPVYRGEAHWGKVKRVQDDSRLERGYKRRFRFAASSPSEIVKIPVPPIVSEDVWKAANATFMKGIARGETNASFLLSGVLRCPHCGSTMTGAAQGRGKGRKEIKRFYVCKTPHAYRPSSEVKTCINRLFPAEELDERVLTGLRAYCDEPEFLANFLSKGSKDTQLESLQKQLEEIESEETLTVQAQIAGMRAGADSSAYEKILRQLAERKAETLREIEARSSKSSGLDRQKIRATFDSVRHLLELELKPHSPELTRVHNFLVVMFEKIEFVDASEAKYADGRKTVKVGDVSLFLRE